MKKGKSVAPARGGGKGGRGGGRGKGGRGGGGGKKQRTEVAAKLELALGDELDMKHVHHISRFLLPPFVLFVLLASFWLAVCWNIPPVLGLSQSPRVGPCVR